MGKRVTRFMSKDEWDAFKEGRILLNETDHFDGGKGGSNSKGFCFTEDTPDEAWKYLKGIVDADVCAVFEFPMGISPRVMAYMPTNEKVPGSSARY